MGAVRRDARSSLGRLESRHKPVSCRTAASAEMHSCRSLRAYLYHDGVPCALTFATKQMVLAQLLQPRSVSRILFSSSLLQISPTSSL